MAAEAHSLLQCGAPVKIHPRAPQYPGKRGVIVLVPIHPVTWFRVRIEDGAVGTFRSSNLIPLDPETGQTIRDVSHGPKPSRKRSGSRDLTDREDVCGNEEEGMEEDEEEEIYQDGSGGTRKTRVGVTHSIKQYPSSSRSKVILAATFTPTGHCTRCNAQRWTGAKFCWNEICASSPIFWTLSGCRGKPPPSRPQAAVTFKAVGSKPSEMDVDIQTKPEDQDVKYQEVAHIPVVRFRSHSDSLTTIESDNDSVSVAIASCLTSAYLKESSFIS